VLENLGGARRAEPERFVSGEHRGPVLTLDPRVEEGAPLPHAVASGRHDELHQSAHARADTDDEAALLEGFSRDRLFG
jgi:hypothetical protein